MNENGFDWFFWVVAVIWGLFIFLSKLRGLFIFLSKLKEKKGKNGSKAAGGQRTIHDTPERFLYKKNPLRGDNKEEKERSDFLKNKSERAQDIEAESKFSPEKDFKPASNSLTNFEKKPKRNILNYIAANKPPLLAAMIFHEILEPPLAERKSDF